jgi:hypothetical protein
MSINFKNLFSENRPVIHNEEYISNKHFLIKKSILKKSQLDYVNNFPLDTKLINSLSQTLENESRKPIITEFIPKQIFLDNDHNILITELDKGCKGVSDWLNKTYPTIQEEYYNFIQSLKCKIYIVSNDPYSTLSIYNSDNEFVGIVLPFKIKDSDIEHAVSYDLYFNKQKEIQEAKKLSKQNSKKCLYISNNKAVIRNKELTCIADITKDEIYKNLYVESDYKKDGGKVFIDFGFICMHMTALSKYDIEPETIKYRLESALDYTFDVYKNYITICLKNNRFINVAEIKLMELAEESKEYVQTLIDHRQKVLDLKAQEEQENRLQREQKDKEYVETKNKIAENLILAAEQAILNKQEVKNLDITIYKSRYNGSTTKIVLYLMKKYNINVPLKTQGWINNALASLQYSEEWGEYSYSHYKTSANSSVFYKYLGQLVKAIQEKYAPVVMV